MVSDAAGADSPLHDVKLSSVVPKSVTGEGAVHELTGMDLAMKLHYVRVVYYFTREDVDGFDIFALKKSMFELLDVYCSVSGRIRRADDGRPVIKCNDAGVRIIEGQCNKSLDEWLENNGEEASHKQLVSGQIVGPVVHFSPVVLIQFTWFKCGGMAVGLSWAHVLGDAVTATNFINMWGKLLAGKKRMKSQFLPRTSVDKPEGKPTTLPLSIKKIEPVGDKWIASNSSNMKSFSFTVPASKLKQIQSKISSHSSANPFDAISALVWKCLAKFREAKIVTICRNDGEGKGEGLLSNKQFIATVETHLNAAEAELSELAQMISEAKKDETKEIEAMAEDEGGTGDYIVYGANLTFVDLQDADLYGLEIKGKKPVHVNFSIDGVGDEGAVMVYKESGKGDEGGRRVVVLLPEDETMQLMSELKRAWTIN